MGGVVEQVMLLLFNGMGFITLKRGMLHCGWWQAAEELIGFALHRHVGDYYHA